MNSKQCAHVVPHVHVDQCDWNKCEDNEYEPILVQCVPYESLIPLIEKGISKYDSIC